MVEDVCRILQEKIKYSVVNMPSRIKMIVEAPPQLSQAVLDRLHGEGYGLRVDVKERLLHVEIQKAKRKRKRVVPVEAYSGKLGKPYQIGKGEDILRYLLGVHDICDFEVHTEVFGKEKHICCKNVECIDYNVVVEACKEARAVCDFPKRQWTFILDNVT